MTVRNQPAPSQPAWHTAATVLIILHFFCLAIGVASNAGGKRSAVGRTLRNVPFATRYLQALFMDLAYDFELGGVAPRNGAHRLTLRLAAAAADDDAEAEAEAATLPAHLPSDKISLRIRRQRYQNLAYHVAELDRAFAESPDDQTRLPLAVADSWIAQLGLDPASYTLRCERIDSPRWETEEEAFDAAGTSVSEGDQVQAFDIHLVWSPLEGQYEGIRAQPTNLTAKAVGATTE